MIRVSSAQPNNSAPPPAADRCTRLLRHEHFGTRPGQLGPEAPLQRQLALPHSGDNSTSDAAGAQSPRELTPCPLSPQSCWCLSSAPVLSCVPSVPRASFVLCLPVTDVALTQAPISEEARQRIAMLEQALASSSGMDASIIAGLDDPGAVAAWSGAGNAPPALDLAGLQDLQLGSELVPSDPPDAEPTPTGRPSGTLRHSMRSGGRRLPPSVSLVADAELYSSEDAEVRADARETREGRERDAKEIQEGRERDARETRSRDACSVSPFPVSRPQSTALRMLLTRERRLQLEPRFLSRGPKAPLSACCFVRLKANTLLRPSALPQSALGAAGRPHPMAHASPLNGPCVCAQWPMRPRPMAHASAPPHRWPPASLQVLPPRPLLPRRLSRIRRGRTLLRP